MLGLRVRIPPVTWMSVVSVVCCQVKFSATGRSLVQRSPTECCVSECDRKGLIWGGPCPPGTVATWEWVNHECRFCSSDIAWRHFYGSSKGRFTHSMPCQCRAHAVPLPSRALIHTCHAAPLPWSDSVVSFVKVRVETGNIRTASPTV
jgi:hypothetical protein